MHTLIGVSLVSLLLSAGPGVPPTGPITPDETDQVHEWPAVKQGVWSIEGTLKPKKGKAKKWKATTKRCEDPATLRGPGDAVPGLLGPRQGRQGQLPLSIDQDVERQVRDRR